MNVLTLGVRVIGPEPAYECAVAFLGATFSGEPRHRRRLAKVLAIEAERELSRLPCRHGVDTRPQDQGLLNPRPSRRTMALHRAAPREARR